MKQFYLLVLLLLLLSQYSTLTSSFVKHLFHSYGSYSGQKINWTKPKFIFFMANDKLIHEDGTIRYPTTLFIFTYLFRLLSIGIYDFYVIIIVL